MRLFVALDIDSRIRECITRFRDDIRCQAPAVRWISPESFHITLQFLGETKKADVIKTALASIRGAPVALTFRGVGFFPNAQRARVFWAGVEAAPHLQPLVDEISLALAPLGFEREAGNFHPHLTLARAGSGRPHPKPGDRSAPALQQVRAELESMPQPEFGTMTAREFFLYESKLSPGGSQYTKLERYPLD